MDRVKGKAVSGGSYDTTDIEKPTLSLEFSTEELHSVDHWSGEGLWRVAYQQLRAECGPLMSSYERLLKAAIPHPMDADIQESIQAILTLKQAQISQKQWKLQWGYRSLKIRTQVDRIIRMVTIFKDVGAIAANADPIHAGLPWAGICLLFAPALNDSHQSEALLTGLDNISDIIARYHIVLLGRRTKLNHGDVDSSRTRHPSDPLESDERPSDSTDTGGSAVSGRAVLFNEELRKMIIRLYKCVLLYQAKAACYLDRNTMARMVRNLPKLDDWTGMLNNIRRLDRECREYTIAVDCANSQNDLDSLTARFTQQERVLGRLISNRLRDERITHRFISYVSDIVVGQDHGDARDRLKSKYWGSGQWLLHHEEFSKWRRVSPAVLWLRGPVGVGKTCLTSVVVQESLANAIKDRVAFFYCSQQQREPVDVLRSLLTQLSLDSDGNLANPALTWFGNHAGFSPSHGVEVPSYADLSMKRKISLEECVDLLSELIDLHDSTTIIIDALDECCDPYKLISCIDTILLKSPNTRVFISARLSIQKFSMAAQKFSISHFNSNSDLQAFIDGELEAPERRAGSGMTILQAAELRKILISRAEGMFRWVELQMDVFLNQKFPIRHPKDFQTKLDGLRSNTMPISLKSIYEEIFHLNIQDQEHARSLADKALRFLLCCFKPLSLDALVQAVALDTCGTIDPFVTDDLILQICSNFIIETQSGCVKFAHRSVRDYLVESYSSGDDTLSKAHAQAASTCLAFVLTLEDDTKWVNLPADAHQNAENIHLTSFEMYACFFWLSHHELAQGEEDPGESNDMLSRFLGTPQSGFANETLYSDSTDHICASISFRKWVSLLWRVFHTSNDLRGLVRQRLEDVISTPPDPIFAICVWGLNDKAGSDSYLHRREYLYRRSIDVESHRGKTPHRSIDIQNHRGKTPIFLACEYGQGRLVRYLVAYKAALDFQHPTWGSTFQAAAWAGDLVTLDFLFKIRTSNNDMGGRIPMNTPGGCLGRSWNAAVSGGNIQVVKTLLEHGVAVWLPHQPLKIPAMGARPEVYPTRRKMGNSSRLKEDTFSKQQERVAQYLHTLYPQGQKLLIDRLILANMSRRQLMMCLKSCRYSSANLANIFSAGDLCREMDMRITRSFAAHPTNVQLGSQVDSSVYAELKGVLNCERSCDHPWPTFPAPYQFHRDFNRIACPCCFRRGGITGLSNEIWRAHVMSDLRPYLCPSDNCVDNERLIQSPEEFSRHMATEHDCNNLGQVNLSCQICGKLVPEPFERYVEHLACHMEKIALLAISPPGYEDTRFSEGQEQAKALDHTESSEEDEDSIKGWSSDSNQDSAVPSDDEDEGDEDDE